MEDNIKNDGLNNNFRINKLTNKELLYASHAAGVQYESDYSSNYYSNSELIKCYRGIDVEMLLDMENHPTLISLNMPFGSSAGTDQSPVSTANNNQNPNSPMPPQYCSTPLNSSYNCNQNIGMPQQNSSGMMMGHGMNNLDPSSYLFSPAGIGSLPGVEMSPGYALAGPTTSLSAGDLPDTKEGIEELCPVCGDKVSGYHYGLLTCESCKGFFKRTVQNKKVYTCVAERSCHIDKTQRKRCPFCRFQKCLEVGMKLEAVRADRMRGGRNKFGPMYKRDRARKLQMMRQRQLAAQSLRGQLQDGGMYSNQPGTSPFNIHIKQEIQIPQVSSLTSSPDSSPSPVAVALGQMNPSTLAQQPASSQQPALQIVNVQNNPQMMIADSKIWANSTTTSPHSLSPKNFQFESVVQGAGSGGGGGGGGVVVPSIKVSPLIRDFVQAIDDREWQNSLYQLLQDQTYNQCEVDLFELMCKVLDQNLFSQVDWARNSIFFKDLKVDDQMKLLQHSWSDMLVLDHIHQRMHNNLPDETTLHNGQKFDLLSLGLLGVQSMIEKFNEITSQLQELKFDTSDYICIKFMLLLNPEVRGITNRKHVQEGHEQVQRALLEYTVNGYPQVQDKFSRMVQILPEIRAMASKGEDHLYQKHCSGSAPTQTLLMEMLHAKRK